MPNPNAVAVFCASSPGNQPAFTHAARSVGHAVGKSGMTLVYGGGMKGLMGVVSEAALEVGGSVTGVIPFAMVRDSKEIRPNNQASNRGGNEHTNPARMTNDSNHRREDIIVRTMHERKVEIAKRVKGFFGLPGGYGTFEELLEMITWSQLEIQNKPVILLNVLGYYNPLKDLIRSGIHHGFIHPHNEKLVAFIDGPSEMSRHATYDWGQDTLNALSSWVQPESAGLNFNWTKSLDGETDI